MTSQPTPRQLLESMARSTREAIDSGAGGVLSVQLLSPLVRIAEHLHDQIDDYVPTLLSLIDEQIARAASELDDAVEPLTSELNAAIAAARAVDGKSRMSELERVADDLGFLIERSIDEKVERTSAF